MPTLVRGVKKVAVFYDAYDPSKELEVGTTDTRNVSIKFEDRYRCWIAADKIPELIAALQTAHDSLSEEDS